MCVCVLLLLLCVGMHACVCMHVIVCTHIIVCVIVLCIYIYVCVCVYFCISVCVYVCNANTHFPTGLFFSIHPTGHCGWHTQQWNTAARDFAETGLQEQNHWQMVSSLDDLSDTKLSSERYWWGPRSQVVEAGETIPNTILSPPGWCCMKMGSDEIHVNNVLFSVRGKGELNRCCPLTTLVPYHKAKPAHTNGEYRLQPFNWLWLFT